MTRGTPASSQIIALERIIKEREIEIEQLRAELSDEEQQYEDCREQLDTTCAELDITCAELDITCAELAAAQAREAKLRTVVLECEGLVHEYPLVRQMARQALALTVDDTALRERLAVERERCAGIIQDAANKAAHYNNLRDYELLRALAEAIRALGDEA